MPMNATPAEFGAIYKLLPKDVPHMECSWVSTRVSAQAVLVSLGQNSISTTVAGITTSVKYVTADNIYYCNNIG